MSFKPIEQDGWFRHHLGADCAGSGRGQRGPGLQPGGPGLPEHDLSLPR